MRIAILSLILASFGLAQSPQYPGSVVTDNQLMVARNRIQSTLSGSVTSSSTTLTVASGTGFTSNMLVTIDSEIMVVCSAIGNTLTIGKASCPNTDGRGFDSTAAASHSSGATVSAFVNAWNINALDSEVKAIETALGANLSNVIAAGTQNAHAAYIGPSSGIPANPTFRALIASDFPSLLTSNTTGNAAGFTGMLTGDVTGSQGATVVSAIGGLPPALSAVVDTTNAGNISAGTLGAARLPFPSATTIGAVQSKDCTSGGQFIQVITTSGTITCGTPAGGGNVSGPGPVSNGFLAQWGGSNNLLTTGLPVSATPAVNTVVESQGSGLISPGWLPAFTGDASSTSGTSLLTFATVNGAPGACGDATHVCVVTTNGKGLVTGQTTALITTVGGNYQSIYSFTPDTLLPQEPTLGFSNDFGLATSGVHGGQTRVSLTSSISATAAGVTGYTFLGSATQILVGSGSFTNGHCVAVGASGNIVDNGSACGSGGGGGTVTSVALSLPGIFTVSGSPVTTTGTLTGTLATQSANTGFFGPSSGGAATPTFRAMQVADMPTGYPYGSLSGAPALPVTIANGGTGQVTKAAAFNALSPVTTLGDLIYGDGTSSNNRLAGNTTATKKLLVQTGTGSVSAAPLWDVLVSADIPNNGANTTGTAAGITGKTFAGTGTKIGTTTGTLTNGDCVSIDVNSNFVDTGSPCGGAGIPTGAIVTTNTFSGVTGTGAGVHVYYDTSTHQGFLSTFDAGATASTLNVNGVLTASAVIASGVVASAGLLQANGTGFTFVASPNTVTSFTGTAGTKIASAAGTFTSGDCISINATLDLVDAGSPCGGVTNNVYYTPRFIFSLSPGTTITAGAHSVTFTTCPSGVNGTDAAHQYYLSGGTGTPETVTGTGGTCVSGSSGTITFTNSNSHSGAWTFTSATAGGQEAANLACAGLSSPIEFPGQTITFHGTITPPCAGLYFSGSAGGGGGFGNTGTVIQPDRNNLILFSILSSTLSSNLHMRAISFSANSFTGGTAINLIGGNSGGQNINAALFSDLSFDSMVGFNCDKCVDVSIRDIISWNTSTSFFGSTTDTGFNGGHASHINIDSWFYKGTPGSSQAIITIQRGLTVLISHFATEPMGTLGTGIVISNDSQGVVISDSLVLQPDTGVHVVSNTVGSSTATPSWNSLSKLEVDQPTTFGIQVDSGVLSLDITDPVLTAVANTPTAISIGSSSSGVRIKGGYIGLVAGSAIVINGSSLNLNIGHSFIDGESGFQGIAFVGGTHTRLAIIGNNIEGGGVSINKLSSPTLASGYISLNTCTTDVLTLCNHGALP